jgi:hypothetical protein
MRDRNRGHRRAAERAEFKILSRISMSWVAGAANPVVDVGCYAIVIVDVGKGGFRIGRYHQLFRLPNH